jgi:thiol-disulfide isomerase/thioredoxin
MSLNRLTKNTNFIAVIVFTITISYAILVHVLKLKEDLTLTLSGTLSIFLFIISTIFLTRKYGSRIIIYSFLSFIASLFKIVNGAFLPTCYFRFFSESLIYFIIGVLIFRLSRFKFSFSELFILLIAPPTLLFLPFGNSYGDKEFYPLIYTPLVSALFLYYYASSKKLVLTSILATSTFLLLAFVAYPNYCSHIHSRVMKEGEIKKDSRCSLPLIDLNTNVTTSINQIEGKIIILYFWYTGCNACKKGFPKFNSFAKELALDSKLYIASLNIPTKNELITNDITINILKDYQFEKLKATDAIDSNQWQIDYYPKILIFDTEHRLRYSGVLNTDKELFVNNIYNLIKEIKKETQERP